MQVAYPELTDSAARVAKVVEAEEKQFDRVLEIGLLKLNDALEAAADTSIGNYEAFQPGIVEQIYNDARMKGELSERYANASFSDKYRAVLKSGYFSITERLLMVQLRSIYTKPMAFLKISFRMPAMMPRFSSMMKASRPPAPKSKPAPAPVGRAAARNPPAPPTAICPRPTSSVINSSPRPARRYWLS
jgi:hypothetical protein